MQAGSVQEQIERARAGEPHVLDRWLLDHYPPLREHVQRSMAPTIQSVVSADDIIQQVYAQVFREIADFQPKDEHSLLAWLKTIANNRLRDCIRGERRQKRGGRHRRLFAYDDQASPFVKDMVDYIRL